MGKERTLWDLVIKVRECVKKNMTEREIQKELNMMHLGKVRKLLTLVWAWSGE